MSLEPIQCDRCHLPDVLTTNVDGRMLCPGCRASEAGRREFNDSLAAWLPSTPPDPRPFYGVNRTPASFWTRESRPDRWYQFRAWLARAVLRVAVE